MVGTGVSRSSKSKTALHNSVELTGGVTFPMARTQPVRLSSALLAFGRRVSAGDAFEELVTAHGWQLESWRPTFVESCDRSRMLSGGDDGPSMAPQGSWTGKQVLRRPPEFPERQGANPTEDEARMMVASATDLPTLYFVEWHYIDFVLSCLGSVSEAARVLGIRRSTLQRKRKKTPPTR
jgi:hypothetical protein